MNNNENLSDLNRREFLKGGSFATLMVMMGGVPLQADDPPKASEGETAYKTDAPPLNCAVIGCGVWGREILNTLARLPNAPVVAVCDNYAPFLRRAKEAAPKAETYDDYKKVIENKDVQGVIVATPTHLHREIVIDALKAGKHVYCEAPLAHSMEDTRAIARAAKAAYKVNFQSGLQMRSDPHRRFLLQFLRSGAMGKTLKARAQWQKKQSWRRATPNPDREKDINWRLRNDTAPGLIGEIGIHQVDVASWFIHTRPVAVTGFGGIQYWNDGRDVPDTIQAVFEYPDVVHFSYEATLANSFDGDYEMFFGPDSAVMLRQDKAWMFKEVDSPLLGWEVYARKDEFYKETGIALVANASKPMLAVVKQPENVPYATTVLTNAMVAFISNSGIIGGDVEDFIGNFGDDEKKVREYLATHSKSREQAATLQDGYEATVTVIKANEAILKGKKITFEKEWFEI